MQVACRPLILSRSLETSYTCLARRAARTNNFWNRLVRRGSIARRCAVYGALQFAFTVVALAVFVPTFFSFRLAVVMQVCCMLKMCVAGWWLSARCKGFGVGQEPLMRLAAIHVAGLLLDIF